VLALALGKTVREIETQMSMRERMEWSRFDYHEPVGMVRADMHAAIIAASIVNALTGKPQRLNKFMPFLRAIAGADDETNVAREVLMRAAPGRHIVVQGNRRPRTEH